MTKYEFAFAAEVIAADRKRLTNQMWKLIPMREKGEDWEDHLKVLIEEICGLSEIYKGNLDYLILLSKLEGLTSNVCDDFMLYRKTVFRCIDLLAKLLNDVK